MGRDAHVLRSALGRNADQSPDWPSLEGQYVKPDRDAEDGKESTFVGADPKNPVAFGQKFNEAGRPVDPEVRDADKARCEAQNNVIHLALQSTCQDDKAAEGEPSDSAQS